MILTSDLFDGTVVADDEVGWLVRGRVGGGANVTGSSGVSASVGVDDSAGAVVGLGVGDTAGRERNKKSYKMLRWRIEKRICKSIGPLRDLVA